VLNHSSEVFLITLFFFNIYLFKQSIKTTNDRFLIFKHKYIQTKLIIASFLNAMNIVEYY